MLQASQTDCHGLAHMLRGEAFTFRMELLPNTEQWGSKLGMEPADTLLWSQVLMMTQSRKRQVSVIPHPLPTCAASLPSPKRLHLQAKDSEAALTVGYSWIVPTFPQP